MQSFSSISNHYKNQISLSSSYGQKKESPFFKPFTQRQLTVNQPNDIYEQEADAMADKVMRTSDNDAQQTKFFQPSSLNVQRKCRECEEEKKKMQRKEINNDVTV